MDRHRAVRYRGEVADSSSRSDSLEQQLRQACAVLVRQLRAGQDARAEDLLREHADIAALPDLAVELVYTEFVTREQLGQQPVADEFLQRFPRYQDILGEQFEVHRLVQAEEEKAAPAGTRSSRLGPYDLFEEIARGSSGVVYRARHRELNRPTAIKMIHVGAGELERFRREAEAVARLSHANIMQVYEVGQEEGRPYLALELVSGGSLAEAIKAKPQPARPAAELVETLARAMAHAHEQGIIHRDLKPANILLQPAVDGAALGAAKIGDFGLARLAETPGASLETGSVAGTPSYMAPEQAGAGPAITPAVDVYALGAILYELLTGRPPFLADSPLNTLAQVVHDDPVPPQLLQTGVPLDLSTICLKCLAKEPHARYGSAAELADDLRRFLDGVPIQARPVGRLERLWKWARRHPARAGLVLVSSLAVVAFLVGSLLFTLHLRSVADNERQLKANALAQTEKLREQLYTIQLAQVGDIWQSDPGRALKLLDDPERCPPELLDFAWGMYYRLCRQDRGLYRLGNQELQRVAFTPDGAMLVAAAPDRISFIPRAQHERGALEPAAPARARDSIERHAIEPAAPARERDSIPLSEPLRAWHLGPDRLTWVDAAGRLHTRDAHEKITTTTLSSSLIRTASFGAAGATLAWIDDQNRLHVGLKTPRWRKELVASASVLTFAADGGKLVVGADTGHLRLFDAATGKELAARQLDEGGPVLALAFAPDGNTLVVSCSEKHLVLVLDAKTLETKVTLAGNIKAIQALAFAPDGKTLAGAGDERVVRVWNTSDYQEARRFKGHTGIIRDLAFDRAGTRIASTGDDGTVRVWDLEQAAWPRSLEVEPARKIVCFEYTSDGSRLVVGRDDGSVLFFDTAQPAKPRSLRCHDDSVLCLDLTESGLLATGSFNGSLRLWDWKTGKLRAELTGHDRRLRAVAFSHDDRFLASAGDDGIVRIWDVAKQELAFTLDAGVGAVRSVSFDPAGLLLATGNNDGTVSVWDLTTRKERGRLEIGRRLILISLFSPDGKTLACGGLDFNVSLWDVATLKPRAHLTGHTEYVFAAAFTPDGRTLATGSGNRFTDVPGEVKLWDVATGHLRATLTGQTGPVAFDPAGLRLATVFDYRTTKLWPALTKDRRLELQESSIESNAR